MGWLSTRFDVASGGFPQSVAPISAFCFLLSLGGGFGRQAYPSRNLPAQPLDQDRRVRQAVDQPRPHHKRQLGDNDTRKKLLNLLPTLVAHLVIDIEKKRYQIVNHVGEVSGWRQLAR